jgi:hypothetical protein
MSYDPQSPSDRADMEPDEAAVCEWCSEIIDPSDVDVEAFETFGGLICRECAEAWAGAYEATAPQSTPGSGSLKTHRRRARRQRAQERAVAP